MYLGNFHHELTVLPSPGNHGFYREVIPFYGRTIQVSDSLQFTQNGYCMLWLWNVVADILVVDVIETYVV